MAHKLDPVMCLLLRHLDSRAARSEQEQQRLEGACMTAFERVILLSHRVKFTPFLILRGVTLVGVGAAERFVDSLTSRICSPVRVPVSEVLTKHRYHLPRSNIHGGHFARELGE
jgi:hypothetical protein